MIKKVLLLVFTVATMVSCGSSKSASEAYNMVNCKYKYNSISGLNVSGMDFSNGFSLAQVPKITAMLSGKSSSIPVNFNLNVNVNNPNEKPAAFHGMDYIVNIDGIDFTTGSVSQPMNIAAGQSQILPLTIGVDLATLISQNSKEAVYDIARNLIGMGTKKSEVTLKVRPTFMIGQVPVTSPIYIPIKFSFGGKKEQ